MMKAAIGSLLDLYASRLMKSPGVEERPTSRTAIPSRQVEVYNHLLWMCREAKRAVVPIDVEKAQRWLGFVQGCLWMLGVFSIDEMRRHVRDSGV